MTKPATIEQSIALHYQKPADAEEQPRLPALAQALARFDIQLQTWHIALWQVSD